MAVWFTMAGAMALVWVLAWGPEHHLLWPVQRGQGGPQPRKSASWPEGWESDAA